jgi:uncharacterized protein involved in exopolysaccharide biosynthesis
MSEPADTAYEELAKQVADLRMEISMRQSDLSVRDGEIVNLKRLVNELRGDYQNLLNKSFEAIIQNSKTVATLVEKMDYR